MKTAKFITFEGGEGSGKTTQSKRIHQYFLDQKIDSIWTREIGGTDLAEKIRDLIVYNDMDERTLLLLAKAARSEHLKYVVEPALEQGKIVVCDRFVDSSAAYQGYKLGIEHVFDIHQKIFGGILPDLTFFIDVPVEIALERAMKRGNNNRFESLPIETHRKYRECFLKLVAMFPERIVKIDGNREQDEIFEEILGHLR
jgi:dTMP kinase